MTYEQFDKNYDVFHAFLVKNAEYSGKIELPCIKTSSLIPEKLVSFSEAISSSWKDYNCWVMFYEHDTKFERLWNNPKRYLEKLKKFNGVISPDFSLYKNMPLVMQMWNTYRNRALAHWLQENGIEVIPNVRFNDERTYDFCFDGIQIGKTVAVGTYGCIRHKDDREYLISGLAEMVKRLSPKTIIVYGASPDKIFKPYEDLGIKIIRFERVFFNSEKRGVA